MTRLHANRTTILCTMSNILITKSWTRIIPTSRNRKPSYFLPSRTNNVFAMVRRDFQNAHATFRQALLQDNALKRHTISLSRTSELCWANRLLGIRLTHGGDRVPRFLPLVCVRRGCPFFNIYPFLMWTHARNMLSERCMVLYCLYCWTNLSDDLNSNLSSMCSNW